MTRNCETCKNYEPISESAKECTPLEQRDPKREVRIDSLKPWAKFTFSGDLFRMVALGIFTPLKHKNDVFGVYLEGAYAGLIARFSSGTLVIPIYEGEGEDRRKVTEEPSIRQMGNWWYVQRYFEKRFERLTQDGHWLSWPYNGKETETHYESKPAAQKVLDAFNKGTGR